MHAVAGKRGFCFGRCLTRAIFVVAMMLVISAVPGMAQQDSSASKLPDAPSQSQSTATPPPAPDDKRVFDLLAGRSRMFPNLASDTQPLTSNQKFVLACRNSVSLFNIFGSAMGAGINQARNADSGYGQGAEGYFKRFGASMAFASSSNLIGNYALASLLHQDPRFFVQNSPTFMDAAKYAMTRVVITRTDSGHRGVNWSGILGPLGASALANTYLPADSQGVGPTFSRWGTSLAITAGTNLLREYWPQINRRLKLSSVGIAPPSAETAAPAAPKPETAQPK